MRKLVYIVSDVEKVLAFEWIAPILRDKFELSFVIIGNKSTPLSKFLTVNNITVEEIPDSLFRSSLSKWFKIYSILKRLNPDIVHTHLWRATLLGITAAWLLRVKMRVFTRHHATIHYDKFNSGLKWDKLCNWLATDIIAISENVKRILLDKDGVNPEKVKIIYHGFKFDYFELIDESRIQNIRFKYALEQSMKWPIIGVIARHVEWKGIQYVIPAFEKLLINYPKAHLILANATGDFRENINILTKRLNASSFTEIAFEEDLAAMYKIFDVYIHVPINEEVEAFGQTYIEALASGVPSVFTISGIASEFISHENAFVANYQDIKSIYEGVVKIIENKEFANKIVERGKESILPFGIDQMIKKTEQLYSR